MRVATPPVALPPTPDRGHRLRIAAPLTPPPTVDSPSRRPGANRSLVSRAAWTVAAGALAAALSVLAAGCGLMANGTSSQGSLPRSEAIVASPAGLEGAVRVDSLSWLPQLVPLGETNLSTELDGVFRARFANLSARPVQVRYDLRFYDRDAFLIDAFIPFGQPLRLSSGEVRRVEGEFRLRASSFGDLMRVAAMRLYATVADSSD